MNRLRLGRLLPWSTLSLGLALAFSAGAAGPTSVCYGEVGKGKLKDGVQLPASGPNFTAYANLDRNFVHSLVAEATVGAYRALAITRPQTHYVYGETGLKTGGKMPPHRTHQRGTSIDFMVPVLDAQGKSVPLPTSNPPIYGYEAEFDKTTATYNGLTIDFAAINAHLKALRAAAAAEGIAIARVIFDKPFLPKLFAAPGGDYVKTHITFMDTEPWIRHDEHYHVDFKVACKPL